DLVKLHDEDTRRKIQGMIPLGRYARAAEIADAAAYLASERAAHITGEVLNVNGGMLMD
ncbi:MAG: SDR family oxidoreductase, partial [Betaproteobacteria bacterium AqS2]|nr:SDR family oxidoreductase [Betaproteobacteria bacterium AqS2]